MTKAEYLSRLESLLSCLPEGQRAESLAFYEEMILDRMEEGLSEEEAVSTLDAPGVVAEAILDDLPAVPRVVAKTRRKSRVLLWVLVILGFPVWGALLAALAITVLSFMRRYGSSSPWSGALRSCSCWDARSFCCSLSAV